jgi:tetratricopeptide (TPR) repeat protein
MKNRALVCIFLIAAAAGAVTAQEDLRQRDALVLYQQGEYEAAIEVCKAELAVMPKRMDAYVVMGWSYLKLNRYDEALEAGQEAYAVSPADYRVIEILGEAHFYKGDNLEALRYFEQYVAIAPEGDRIDIVYYLMGEIFIRLGEFNHADIALTTALYHSPNVAKWWARLGYAREMASDFSWAIDAYRKALQLNATFTEAERGIERVREKMENG